MTEQEKQELSKAVADKYGHGFAITQTGKWLHDDSARCFDLMVEHGIRADCGNSFCVAIFWTAKGHKQFSEWYKDFNDNKQEATRIAILKALLAKD